MIFDLSLDKLTKILKVNSKLSGEFSGFSMDSRVLPDNSVFIALPGEHYDGANFIKDALQNGAIAVITDNVALGGKDARCIVVNDVELAFNQLAACFRQYFVGNVIALTGSCGKTSTRHTVSNILRHKGSAVLESYKNYNNHFGVPYMLLNLRPHYEHAVLECGASGPFEIQPLAELICPNVAAITNIYPVHLSGFGSVETIARTKGALFESLPTSGLAVLPANSPFETLWLNQIGNANKLTFGLSSNADVYADNIKYYANKTTAIIKTPFGHMEIDISLPGEAMLLNVLAAIAILSPCKLSDDFLISAISRLTTFANRFDFKEGFRKGLVIIDDCYNASPMAMKMAADLLILQSGYHVAIIGDMYELGSDQQSVKEHSDLGVMFRQKGIRQLFAVGDFAKHAAESFGENGFWFASKKELLYFVLQELNNSAEVSVLVKASRGMQMEVVVDGLLVGEEH